MAAIGMLLLWSSYTLILYGVCQLRNYQITMLDLVLPGRWKGGWPPPTTGSAGSSGSGPGGQEGPPDQNGAIPVNPPSTPMNPQPAPKGEPWWQQLLNGVPISNGTGNQKVTPL